MNNNFCLESQVHMAEEDAPGQPEVPALLEKPELLVTWVKLERQDREV